MPQEAGSNKGLQPFRSLNRGLSILRLFTAETPQLSATDIVGHVAMHKTTTYRMLATLAEQGFLARNEMTGKYSIGPVMYLLGSLYQQSDSLQVAAAPVVALLSDLTGEACSLAILSEDVVVHLLLGETCHEVGWDRYIGMTLPAHTCALGKSLLSALTDAEIDHLYPEETLRSRTPNTVPTRSALKAELAQVRTSGVAIDDEGCVPGVAGRGSPVVDHRGVTVAAFSVSVPVFRFPASLRPLYASAARVSAQLISYRLGYRGQAISIATLEQLQSWWLKAKAEHAQGQR
ncbi:MAG: IclR family transcriptional regulator [Dehalococcoidia bacterium]|nr:IclR family transcriptional regulator [Dehalococcoidia bacterium]